MVSNSGIAFEYAVFSIGYQYSEPVSEVLTAIDSVVKVDSIDVVSVVHSGVLGVFLR
jgi:hypothetical protein